MNVLRTRAVLGMIVLLAVSLSVLRDGKLFDGEHGVYLAAGEDAPASFQDRRSFRSWHEDIAGWSEGSEQLLRADPDPSGVPADPIIGRSAPVGKSEVATTVVIGATHEENRIWLTARHAIAGCATIRIAAGIPGRAQPLLAAQPLVIHPSADLALVETGRREGDSIHVPHVAFNADDKVAIHVGFPGGRPAAIYSDLLGMTRVRWLDNSLPAEAYRVWAERAQVPANLGRLNGLSGGATMNRHGELIGVVVGVSERRGRILSARHRHIATLLEAHDLPAISSKTSSLLDQSNYPAYARALIEERRVARLNCERS